MWHVSITQEVEISRWAIKFLCSNPNRKQWQIYFDGESRLHVLKVKTFQWVVPLTQQSTQSMLMVAKSKICSSILKEEIFIFSRFNSSRNLKHQLKKWMYNDYFYNCLFYLPGDMYSQKTLTSSTDEILNSAKISKHDDQD